MTSVVMPTLDLVENLTSPEIIKPKRGRKSKKDLLASLQLTNALNITKLTPVTIKQLSIVPDNVSLIVTELVTELVKDEVKDMGLSNNVTIINNLYANIQENNNVVINALKDTDTNANTNANDANANDTNANDTNANDTNANDVPSPVKKRGRKPKGGKIVQQIMSPYEHIHDKPNVILHLKCSMKDLQTQPLYNDIEPFSFIGKKELCYDLVGAENINNINTFYNNKIITNNVCVENNDGDECESDDGCVKDTCKKEIWKKLKQLEHNLHINNTHNKKSACFWDTCAFDNPPIYIPKHFINGTYHVYGCFCSPECAVADLMNECIDSSTKFERYHLLNNIYSKIYDYKKSIKPSPNPFYMLEKYYGNLTTQEYRSLLRNERLFLIVDKPLTRILPELHEDNDDFILNNKIIPSNNYQVKNRLQRKKQNKSSILNEKFGILE